MKFYFCYLLSKHLGIVDILRTTRVAVRLCREKTNCRCIRNAGFFVFVVNIKNNFLQLEIMFEKDSYQDYFGSNFRLTIFFSILESGDFYTIVWKLYKHWRAPAESNW